MSSSEWILSSFRVVRQSKIINGPVLSGPRKWCRASVEESRPRPSIIILISILNLTYRMIVIAERIKSLNYSLQGKNWYNIKTIKVKSLN